MGSNQQNAHGGVNRRRFLQQTGLALGAAGMAACADSSQEAARQLSAGGAADSSLRFSVVVDPADALAQSPPARWAIDRLAQSLAARGAAPEIQPGVSYVASGAVCILAAASDSGIARAVLGAQSITVPDAAESLGLVWGQARGRRVLLACGKDARGLSYALNELADRIDHANALMAAQSPARRADVQLLQALQFTQPIIERPATRIRSVMKIFTSDVEDKSWFNDREQWKRYLSMLAAQRFNRFNLSLGIGYDFNRNIKDAYFYFAYPFLLAVPGYDVRVSKLADSERDSNLQMLRFISDEATARGLHFQLGLWTHAYTWADSPGVNHTIEGLTPQTHAPYCREALKLLLQSCPKIAGINFRIHGESGVPEGNYDFWKTVFDGIVQCGRKVEIDMHAKGMDQAMIDVALATGMPVNVDPKSWAEHMGLPYHQAGIRSVEMPPPGRRDNGFFSRSSGSRSFLRYGYGDLLTNDRKYGVLHRTWPGTQRLLLWGDPEFAAGYASFANFCGSAGLELFEPLSFKGRKGSGIAGGRDAYADSSLKTEYDWEKYLYTYRLWGRLLYNPKSDPQIWRRVLAQQLGHPHDSLSDEAGAALAHASRIIPLITTAHCPSAANNNYWPEMYSNMSIVDAAHPGPYGDTPSPKRFGAVSPLDPEMFYRVDDFAGDLLKGQTSGKFSPLEVSIWLEDLAAKAMQHLSAAEKLDGSPNPASRRLAMDVRIQAGIGRFFAAKFRTAVLWAIHLQSGDASAAQQAITAYESARKAWAEFADGPAAVYVRDITFGLEKQLRGHWRDRLPAIDADIALMRDTAKKSPPKDGDDQVKAAIAQVFHPAPRPALEVRHESPASFKAGESIKLNLIAKGATAALLHYRHVDQAETFVAVQLNQDSEKFSGAIPAAYTRSPFGIQYYVELRNESGRPTIYPGFKAELSGQPYMVVRQAKA